MAEIFKRDSEAHEKLTGELLFQPTGESGYISTGNAMSYKHAAERSFVKHTRAEDGIRRVDDSQVDVVEDAWEFELSEQDGDNMRFIHLATKAASATQALVAAPNVTGQFTATKLGRTYFVGKLNIVTLVVSVSASAKTLGTDYTVDLAAGSFTILPTGTIADGATVDITCGCAAVVSNTYSADEAPQFRGTIKIIEKNQHTKVPLKVTEFTGVIAVTAFPEQSGENGKFTVRATASSKPSILKRHAA